MKLDIIRGRWVLLLCLGLMLSTLTSAQAYSIDPGSSLYVSSNAAGWLAQAAPSDTTTFIVGLRDADGLQAQANQGVTIRNKAARRAHVHSVLSTRAQQNTQLLQSFLSRRRLNSSISSFQAFQAFNGFSITANKHVIETLRSWDQIASIELDETIYLPKPQADSAHPRLNALEWNISKIGADRVWNELGINGSGIVVGGLDTGVRYTHEVLRANYKCAGMTNHSACWKDAMNNRTTPYDDFFHGTHTMGSAVGQNGVGVAPGAKWIACKALSSSGSTTDILECFDWFLAPGGSSANAPDVVVNSWGGGGGTGFQQGVTNWVNAGIFPEFSNGNSGPGCGTVQAPASYSNAFGVGSTDINDVIASSSSRGPSSSGMKPQVSAPGVSIRSATNGSDTSYGTYSGTSMAGPHVGGLVALLLDANDSLTITQMKTAIQNTAQGIPSSNCSSSGVPNNVYGYGRIRAYEAVRSVMGGVTPTPSTVTPTPPTVTPTPPTVTPTPPNPTVTLPPDTIFSDNFETNKGWTLNPDGTDTATNGRWERGVPEPTDYQGPKQIAAASPSNDLVTGRMAGSDAGNYDLDGGLSSINSPAIALPSGSNPTLTFKYYLAHADNGGSDDFLRVSVVEDIPTGGRRTTVLLEKRAAASDLDAVWATGTASLNAFDGQTVRILIEAADNGTGSLIEAAIDDVVIKGSLIVTPTPVTPTPITVTPNPLVFADDFETNKGWTVNPNGSDTATSGRWERGNPEPTSYNDPSRSPTALQLDAADGLNDLVTGPLAGATVGDHDLDGGVSSIHSPAIALPSSGDLTLSFKYYLAHLNNASSDDYLRISVVEDIPTGKRVTVMFEKRGTASNVGGSWATATANLNAFAGQTVRILIEASDSSDVSLIEAGVDDVRISR